MRNLAFDAWEAARAWERARRRVLRYHALWLTLAVLAAGCAVFGANPLVGLGTLAVCAWGFQMTDRGALALAPTRFTTTNPPEGTPT